MTGGEAVRDGEADLLRRMRNGDDAAFELFVREHTGRSLAVAKRLLNHEQDAADAVQDAFVSFFKSLDQFDGAARLSTWFHRIVINAALMKRRKRGSKSERSIEPLLPEFLEDGHPRNPAVRWTPSAVQNLLADEKRERIRALIDKLPDDFRNVVLLRDIEALDTAETADLLGISAAAVKTRLHRARQALRTLLEEGMIEWAN